MFRCRSLVTVNCMLSQQFENKRSSLLMQNANFAIAACGRPQATRRHFTTPTPTGCINTRKLLCPWFGIIGVINGNTWKWSLLRSYCRHSQQGKQALKTNERWISFCCLWNLLSRLPHNLDYVLILFAFLLITLSWQCPTALPAGTDCGYIKSPQADYEEKPVIFTNFMPF